MSALRTFVWTALIALTSLVGCGSPLVGLECRDGFERCGGSCYDLTISQEHCGGCDIACSADQHCEMSMCMAGALPPEGGVGDAGMDGGTDGGRGDASFDATVLEDGRIIGPDGETLQPDGAVVNPDGSTDNPDGAAEDGGSDDGSVVPPPLCMGPSSPSNCVCGIGTVPCNGTCVDLMSDNTNCGMCGMACPVTQFCSFGQCGDICTLPLVFCNGGCVDFTSDDNNCMSCGRQCAATAQCIDSQCVGKVTGHTVVIGHDMTGPLRTAIRQLVANSVFLAPRATVRVLVYDAATSVASRAGVTAAIAAAALNVGRQYTLSVALPDSVTAQLASADVFVIDPQQEALDTDLTALGVSWSAALSDFMFRGGVVVLFDGGATNTNQGTWQILHAASDTASMAPFLQVTAATPLASLSLLDNARPGDAIGINVPSPYQSAGATVGFTVDATPTNPHLTVIQRQTAPNLPVVLHVLFDQM